MRARYFRNLIILAIAVSACNFSRAQDASRIYIEQTGWSIGTDIGLTDLWGDVGTKSPIQHYINGKYFDKVCFMGGLFGRYTVHPALAIRLMANYGTFYATDQWNYNLAKSAGSQGADAYQRYARGQNAKPDIFENSISFEITPLRLNPESKAAHRKGQVYLGLGVGYFHFTPKSTVGNGNTYVNTYDLHLEGDGFGAGYPPGYSLWQFSIPLFIGYRFDLGEHINLGLEFNFRKTFTDYLDGVSGKYIDPKAYGAHMSAQDAKTAEAVADKAYLLYLQQPNLAGNLRGDASNKDAYSTITLSIYYKVFSRTKEWWKQRIK